MTQLKKRRVLSVVTLVLLSLTSLVILPRQVTAKGGPGRPGGPGKTVICHRTGSASNPFVRIELPNVALRFVLRPGDIINPPGGVCS